MRALPLAGCLAGSMIGQGAQAQLINGDFETGAYSFDGNGAASLPSGSTVITGWTTISNELAVINNANVFGIVAQSGTKSLDLTGYHDASPYGGIQQSLNTISGQNYTLSFWLGSAGGNASVAVGTGGAPTTFTNAGTGAFWQQFTQNFTASGPTVLSFTGTAASGGGTYIGLDHVTVTGVFAATPEPGSVALLGTSGLSLIGLYAARRRRAKKRTA